MAVDQPRTDPIMRTIDDIWRVAGRTLGGTGIGYPAVAARDNAIFDNAEPLPRHRHKPGVAPNSIHQTIVGDIGVYV